ncbi:Sau3AI family type II restriction endonuclease [Bifidobacterium panos]|uniref:Restriction endonuclease Sau3AI n=1 Tax=Bifidobacterium panos TaxID=2675321 RepID=A0ABX1SY13_9BIFI|nr:Sau3AI family type II restriction endonuclease [Bifidobacterium sp. DSM 109963]NMN02245.1 restriction endonuclease Sau3AI [Bifidobacterium sp. DSM 109963]
MATPSGTTRIIEAVCLDKNRNVLCLPSPQSDLFEFPKQIMQGEEDPKDILEHLLMGIYKDELSIGPKMNSSTRTIRKRRYQTFSYLCYPDLFSSLFNDGRQISWIPIDELNLQQFEKEDHKTVERLQSPFFGANPYRTKTAIQKHADEAIGLTMGEIDSENTRNLANKSYPGNVIEQIWFDHPADSIAAPDFPEADVELKVTPVDTSIDKQHKRRFKAGERLVLNIINYRNEEDVTFKESSFWKKNKFLEIVQYLRRDTSLKGQEEDKRLYKVEFANMLALEEFDEPDFPVDSLICLSDKHKALIEQDWNTIQRFISSSQMNAYTESLTKYLAACTKGQDNTQLTTQPNGEYTKSRAYSFTQRFMTEILQEYILKNHSAQSLIQDAELLSTKTDEEIILDYFNPYRGKSMQEIADKFNIRWSHAQAPKNLVYMLVCRMLKLSNSAIPEMDDDFDKLNIEEFNNGKVRVKTITLFNGQPQQNFKVQGIPNFEELISQSWEESDLYNFLETQRFLLLVFDNTNSDRKDRTPSGIRFLGATFWSVPAADLNGDIASVWNEDTEKIRKGIILNYQGRKVYNNFVKESARRILHLRPDARVSQYCPPFYTVSNDKRHLHNNSRQLPTPVHWLNRPADHSKYTDSYITKQAWWLNKNYMYEQIKHLL